MTSTSDSSPDYTQEIRDASPPFDKATADVILRSVDRVDFRVRKAILAEASPIFEAMFGLPQPGKTEMGDDNHVAEYRDNLPVVQMEEQSTTLDDLLRLCYPVPDPSLRDLAELRPVLDAALKYVMDGVVQAIRVQMRSLVNEAGMPLRIYAISIQHKFEGEVRLAALCSLAQPIVYEPELEEITAGAYHRLLDYHKQCRKAAADLEYAWHKWIPVKNWIFLQEDKAVKMFGKHPDCEVPGETISIGTNATIQRLPRTWWWNYMQAAQSEIEERPCGKALVEAEDIRFTALLKASRCTYCKVYAASDLRDFIAVYAATVDTAVGKVILQIK